MKEKKFGIMLIGLMLVVGLLFAVVPAGKVSAATPIYVRPGGDDTLCDGTVNVDYSVGVPPACAVKTIQRGIDLVNSGGIVNVYDGTYVLSTTLNINKSMTLQGHSQTAVIIDASGIASGYGISSSGDYETLIEIFTLIGPTSATNGYGIKVSGENARTSISFVTVRNSGRSGIDLNGVSGQRVNSVTLLNNGGAGLALTDCSSFYINKLTTSGNGWGGLAIFTGGGSYTPGSTGIWLDGPNSFSEPVKLYIEENPAYPVINFKQDQFLYTVENLDAPGRIGFAETKAEAIAGALATPAPLSVSRSYITKWSDKSLLVAPGMSIQSAINAATAGDTINVEAGTYYEKNILINKSLTLLGDPGDANAGPGLSVPVIDGGSAYGDAILLAHGVSNVTIKGFEIRNYTTSNFNGVGNAISAWVGSTTNITVADNYFHHLGYNAVRIGNDKSSDPTKWGDHTNWLIKDNVIDNFGLIGFELTNISNSSIEENVFHLSTQVVGAIQLVPRRSETGLDIKNNIIDGTSSTVYSVIWISAYDLDMVSPNLDDVYIFGNTISTTGTSFQIEIYNIGSGTVTNVVVENNNLKSLKNRNSQTIDASPNYWGTAVKSVIQSHISGSATFEPYYVDAARTLLNLPLPPVVYVNGTYTDGAAGGHIFGYDGFATIQTGIDGVASGGTVNVAAGTYDEYLLIEKELTLLGPNADINPNTGTRVAEALIKYPSGLTGAWNLVKVLADNVTFKGFYLDGKDLNTNFYDAHAVFSMANNFTVKNNIIKNFMRNGVLAKVNYAGPYYSGILVENNKLTCDAGFYFDYSAIFIQGAQGTIRGNDIDCARRGIQIQPYKNPTITMGLVENNTIKAYQSPLYFNYSEHTNSDWLFQNNVVTGIPWPALETKKRWDGLLVEAFYHGKVVFSGNSVAYGTANGTVLYPFGIMTWPTTSTGTLDLDATFTSNTFERVAVITDGTNIIKKQMDMAFYSTIQSAINDASDGNTILVGPGTYNEINILINKSLTLIGDPGDASAGPGVNAPVIDGGSAYGDAILLANGVSNVTIKGFEIRNYTTSGFNGVGNAISAWVGSTTNITVADNYFHHLGYNGVLVGNDYNSDPAKWGDHTGWLIKDNIIENFGYIGFELTNTSSSTIEENVIHMSTPYIGAIFSSARRSEAGLDIKNNVIDGTPSTAYPVIYIYAYDLEMVSPNFDDVYIFGNTISTTGTPFQIYLINFGTGTITNVVVENNNLKSLKNLTSQTVDASPNYWGSACGPEAGKIVGDVTFSPWYTDAAMTMTNTVAATYHFAAGSTAATMNPFIACAANGSTFIFDGNTSGGIVVPGTKSGLTFQLNGQTVGAGSPAFTIEGDDITIQGPGVLDGLTGNANNTSAAIEVAAGADNFRLLNTEIMHWRDGVELQGSVVSFKVVGNWFHDNSESGLQINSGVVLTGVITIEGNLFKENLGPGIQNDSGLLVETEYNSWGAYGGPTAGGDGVSDLVDYDPWNFLEPYMDVFPDSEALVRNVNETETFDVALKVDAQKLYGVAFRVTWDATQLDLVTTDFTAPWDNLVCTQLTPVVLGQITYRCNLIYPTAEYTADGGTIMTLTFTPKSGLSGNGPWEALFDIAHFETLTSAGAVGGVKIWVNNAGYGLPSIPEKDITDTDDGKVIITGIANYTGFVDLQGNDDDSGAILQVLDMTTKAGSTVLANATSASGGQYVTAHITPNVLMVGNVYYLFFDADLYLPTTIMAVDTSLDPDPLIPTEWAHSKLLSIRPLTPLNYLMLLGGDAVSDDVIDILDAGCIGGAYNTSVPYMTTCGDQGSSDVTGDTFTDMLDLVLMGGNFTWNYSPWIP